MATDAIDEHADDEDEPEHPDDVQADDGEHVRLRMVVADDDVSGRFITPAITAKLATAAITAAGTPGRRRI